MNGMTIQNITALLLALAGIIGMWVTVNNSRTLSVDKLRDDLNVQYQRVKDERDQLQAEKDSWKEWIREAIVDAIAEGLATRLANRRKTDG